MLAFALMPFLLASLMAPAQQSRAADSGCIIPIPILCPSPSPSPTPSPVAGSPGPTATPSAGPTPTGSGTPDPSGTPSPSSSAKPKKASAVKAAAPALTVSAAQFTLVTGSAELLGTAYDGVAQVPTADGGAVPMMKFTMNSLTLEASPTLTVTQSGASAVTRASSMHFTGNVVLYATRLSGDLLGIPVTLTPDSPLATILQLLNSVTPLVPLRLTRVTTDQPYIFANSAQFPGLQLAAS